MILAAARRFTAAPLLRGTLAPARAGGAAAPSFVAVRNAASVTTPRPLSIRMDSLFVKCTIAAVIYFGPQDAVFLSGLFWLWHVKASSISPKKCQPDAAAAVEEYKAKKGLDNVKVAKGSRTWHVGFA
mmetsp:Transcript_53301/g.155270  ORF Transcript_53301/g.155270 Transcript_53301/m.155270 type:complete len:128 (+) Transcript_53301:73-456(+)